MKEKWQVNAKCTKCQEGLVTKLLLNSPRRAHTDKTDKTGKGYSTKARCDVCNEVTLWNVAETPDACLRVDQ